ncbi:MAG: VWA domain-containing protein [Lentisphaeria bacterium]
MKIQQYLILSVIVSVLFHLLVFGAAANIYVNRKMEISTQNPQKKKQYMVVKNFVQKPEIAKLEEKKQVFASSKKLASINNDIKQELQKKSVVASKLEKVFKDENLLESITPKYKLDTNLNLHNQNQKDVQVKSVEITAPRPKIVEIDFNKLAPERRALPNRIFTPKLARLDSKAFLLPSLAANGPLSGGSSDSYNLGLKSEKHPHFGSLGADLKNFGLENKASDSLWNGSRVGGKPDSGDQYLFAALNRPAGSLAPRPLDHFVNVKVRVLKDKFGLGGFFQVDISPNEFSDSLRDVSKDSLFIIDHSNSISVSKLSKFKAATREALNYLNPSDRFNVVSFTDYAKSVFPKFEIMNASNKSIADNYISSLYRGGMTDVFAGLAPFVKASNGDMDRPLNVFLLTDGQSTVNIHSSDEFLRRITGINPGNVSIYPFSVGNHTNRELLDYLGYLNRGKQNYVKSVDDLQREVVDFISAHSSMIIMDLRYMADKNSRAEIFPKDLPHLYRQESLRLYGRYENEEDELVLALTGRDYQKRYSDLVFRRKYKECGRADQKISREWALQKIFYLLAQKNCVTNQEQKNKMEGEIQKIMHDFELSFEN